MIPIDFQKYQGGISEQSPVTDREDYQYYQLLHETGEPFELRETSLNPSYFIALTIEFLINSVALSLLVIGSSLILINDVENQSFQFNLAEQVSKQRWIYAHQVSSFLLFIIGIILSLAFSRLLIHPFQENFIEGASLSDSLAYPFIHISGNEVVSIASFIVIVLLSIIILYLFLIQLFECILIYLKNPIFSGVLYLAIVLGVGYYSEPHYSMNRWWNPFQLFYLKDHLPELTIQYTALLILSTLGWAIIIQYSLFKRLKKKPI